MRGMISASEVSSELMSAISKILLESISLPQPSIPKRILRKYRKARDNRLFTVEDRRSED
jgi:hypothetical protein